MAIAGLQALAVYSPSTFEKPSVRAIQAWIEDAWRAGFDAVGREQLRGKLVGTNKWIGTTGE
jgi:hypothetical protein